MNKQTTLSIGFAGLAIAVGGLLYLSAPSVRSDEVSQNSTQELPGLPFLEAQDAPIFEQPEARFNEGAPSMIGTVVAIQGTKIELDVVEQPKDLSGTIVNRRVVRISGSVAATLSIGQQIRVFVATESDLADPEITATRVEPVISE